MLTVVQDEHMDITPYEHPFYLIHATPAGQRVAYPAPAKVYPWREGSWHGIAIDGDETVVPATERDGFIVLEQPVDRLVRTWLEPGSLGPWTKRPEEPQLTDGIVHRLWLEAPELAEGRTLHILNDLLDEDDDVDRALWQRVYHRKRAVDVEARREYDVSTAAPFPGEPRPRIGDGRTWTPDDRSAGAVYGSAMLHLVPGTLSGFFEAVAARVEQIGTEMDLVGLKVYTHGKPTLSVFHTVLWDKPVPRSKTKADRGRGPFTSKSAMTQHVELVVPRVLKADSLQAALEVWDDLVEQWAARFIPLEGKTTACSACKGLGYHLAGR